MFFLSLFAINTGLTAVMVVVEDAVVVVEVVGLLEEEADEGEDEEAWQEEPRSLLNRIDTKASSWLVVRKMPSSRSTQLLELPSMARSVFQ